jgi:hypothetical protein
MKMLLALAAALSLSTAVHAQTDQTQSDQYACNHGDPNDPGTAAACQRLRSGEGSPAPSSTDESSASSETTPAPVSPAPAPATPVAALPTAPAPATPAPTASAAAAPVPTDVGEAPLNVAAQNGADEANQDADNTDISSHGSWFAGLGALAVIAIAIACFSGLAIYFIPTMIAIGRHKRNTLAIFALNLFLGWSFIGWVAALIWSLTSERSA